MERTLYVTDLDGTLLHGGCALSPFTIQVLREKVAGGLLFSYATARSYSSASKVTEGLDFDLPVVTYNGAFIVNGRDGKPVEVCCLDKEKAAPVLTMLQEEGVSVLAYAQIGGRDRVSWITGNENPGLRGYLASRVGDPRLRAVENYEDLFAGELFYLTVIGGREEISHLVDMVGESPDYRASMLEDTYIQGEWWLEIYRRDVSKESALGKLKRLLQVDRVVAFGDNFNDLSMFRMSDECYAVANAKDEVKAAATGVILSNDEDGVARWLLENT